MKYFKVILILFLTVCLWTISLESVYAFNLKGLKPDELDYTCYAFNLKGLKPDELDYTW